MLSMRIDTMLAAMVRQLLLEEKREEALQGANSPARISDALHFHLDLSLSHHTNSKSYGQRRGLHLLYQVNPGFTYINVFSAVFSNPFDTIDKVEKWTHECTHDSCWRDIRLFSELYFEMAEQINLALVADSQCKIPPRDMSEHNCFRLFGKMYDWQKVLITKDPTDLSNYRKVLQLVKE